MVLHTKKDVHFAGCTEFILWIIINNTVQKDSDIYTGLIQGLVNKNE